jgi:iron complex transport system substrate-binding protein
LGKQGNVAEVTLDEWLRFNPQVIYGCGGDQELAGKFFSQPGWKDVEAIRSGNVFYFPCELTCRASVHTGEFVSWLASTIYSEEFAETKNRVLEEKRVGTTLLDVPLEYVRSARVDESTIFDFPNKSLVVELREPMRVTSTLEGERAGILTVGNHYTSPPCWSVTHRLGLEACRNHIYKAIGKSKKNSCFLFTGADMANLSVRKSQFGDLSVYALVTAGVKGNAVRMSMDEGRFVEPGTINVILMANRKLMPRAMARAIISATEAKTAALQDLDVRSGPNPQRWQATGTGTDEVLVVEGRGGRIDNAGGHCKLGELVAKAVYEGVREAVYRQNGITAQRNVFRRLQERHVSPYGMLCECACFSNDGNLSRQVADLEGILLEPRYASFMESAFALSDAYERGLISELVAYRWWCHQVAEEIAGRKITGWKDWVTSEDIPVVVRISLNALLNGMKWRTSQE